MSKMKHDLAAKRMLAKKRLAERPPQRALRGGLPDHLVAVQTRARLVAQNPTASDDEIDAMLGRILLAGTKKCSETLLKGREIPKAVRDARRAERKAGVRKRKGCRRPRD